MGNCWGVIRGGVLSHPGPSAGERSSDRPTAGHRRRERRGKAGKTQTTLGKMKKLHPKQTENGTRKHQAIKKGGQEETEEARSSCRSSCWDSASSSRISRPLIGHAGKSRLSSVIKRGSATVGLTSGPWASSLTLPPGGTCHSGSLSVRDSECLHAAGACAPIVLANPPDASSYVGVGMYNNSD